MNWLRAVHDATDAQALLALVNEYLLAYPEACWSWIPPEARPRLVATVAELHEWHRCLSDHLAAAESPNIRLQDLAVFFLQASARALDLEATGPSSNEESCDTREAG